MVQMTLLYPYYHFYHGVSEYNLEMWIISQGCFNIPILWFERSLWREGLLEDVFTQGCHWISFSVISLKQKKTNDAPSANIWLQFDVSFKLASGIPAGHWVLCWSFGAWVFPPEFGWILWFDLLTPHLFSDRLESGAILWFYVWKVLNVVWKMQSCAIMS